MMKQDPTVSQDDGFDNFLRMQLQHSQPYLMDDNFSAQVMAALPASRKLSLWQERLIMLVPCLVISLLVLSQFSLIAFLVKGWTWLMTLDTTSLLGVGLSISASAISGASFWFAKQFKLI